MDPDRKKITDPVTVIQPTAANLKNEPDGHVAHDSIDSGKPIKVGAKAIDYTPDSGVEEGVASVAANDRVNLAANLKGEQVECVKAQYTTLTDLNQTYDDDPTTDVSASVDCWQYRQATLSYELDKANTPTDIRFEIEVSLDGTNYTKLMNWFLADLRYDDTAIGAGLEESVTFPIACQKIR